VYGAAYLQKLLEPLLKGIITTPEWQQISFEVDPTRHVYLVKLILFTLFIQVMLCISLLMKFLMLYILKLFRVQRYF